MCVFWSAGGANHLSGYSWRINTMFGNMGFAGSFCAKNWIDWSEFETDLAFSCQGTTVITEVFSSGIVEYQNNTDKVGL